jgi:hypothetical protein
MYTFITRQLRPVVNVEDFLTIHEYQIKIRDLDRLL